MVCGKQWQVVYCGSLCGVSSHSCLSGRMFTRIEVVAGCSLSPLPSGYNGLWETVASRSLWFIVWHVFTLGSFHVYLSLMSFVLRLVKPPGMGQV